MFHDARVQATQSPARPWQKAGQDQGKLDNMYTDSVGQINIATVAFCFDDANFQLRSLKQCTVVSEELPKACASDDGRQSMDCTWNERLSGNEGATASHSCNESSATVKNDSGVLAVDLGASSKDDPERSRRRTCSREDTDAST